MKGIALLTGFLLKIGFTFVFVLSFFELLFLIPPVRNFFGSQAQPIRDESYDPALFRLNSVAKLEAYTDSLYQLPPADTIRKGEARFPLILGEIVRMRFFHGYPAYGVGNNFLAMFASRLTGRSYDAIVNADDILKYPNADCRQQSLVMMELLRKRGYLVRSVHMKAEKAKEEHFTFETFYDGSWHFSDPDLEPNAELLLHKRRPSVEELSKDSAFLTTVYNKQKPAMIVELFHSYRLGKVNELMPSRVYMFHSVTKVLSGITWIICLLIYFVFLRSGKMSFRPYFVMPEPQRRWQTAFSSLF